MRENLDHGGLSGRLTATVLPVETRARRYMAWYGKTEWNTERKPDFVGPAFDICCRHVISLRRPLSPVISRLCVGHVRSSRYPDCYLSSYFPRTIHFGKQNQISLSRVFRVLVTEIEQCL